jgi:hypothetical protein
MRKEIIVIGIGVLVSLVIIVTAVRAAGRHDDGSAGPPVAALPTSTTWG